MGLELVGWLATAVFTASYMFRKPSALRIVQAIAAALWLIYGLAIHSSPVIVANIIVVVAALYSAFFTSPEQPQEQAD